MINKKTLSVIIGIIAILFSSYALVTHNDKWLLLPLIQLILGLVTADMLVSGISSIREKRKGLGLFFIFIALFMLIVIILNNTMTINGIIPVVAMYIVLGIPIIIIAIFAYKINTKNEL